MIYTETTKKAMKIAFEAHKGQVDKAGIPYIYHPIHLAEQMETETAVCAALLHDVVEDTDITFEDLKAQGISEAVVEVLQALTHDKNVPYMEYVKGILAGGNKAAVAVKLADLRHNADLTRLNVPHDEKALQRAEKYKEAIRLLEQTHI